MKIIKRLNAIALAAIMMVGLLAPAGLPAAYAEGETPEVVVNDGPDVACTALYNTNLNANNYLVWTSPIKTYLARTDSASDVDSTYMKVSGHDTEAEYGKEADNHFDVEYYDGEFNIVCRKTVRLEMPYFGAFYETAGNYFIVCGDVNFKADDTFKCVRVIKYDKTWKRLASCDLEGANTRIPFDGGACRIVMYGNYMVIQTAHKMYNGHQSNFTIVVDTSGSMKVTDSHHEVSYDHIGYTSHSFNQFIKIVGDRIILLDQGDAYPRELYMQNFRASIVNGVINYGESTETTIFAVPGGTGDNDTGISVGGFEQSSSGYLTAGNAIYQHNAYEDPYSYDENVFENPRDIFIYYIDANGNNAIRWLTDVGSSGTYTMTPQLVKISDNKFMVLWGETNNFSSMTWGEYEYDEQVVKYTFIDGKGVQSGQVYTLDGALSDCVPFVDNGDVVWQTGYGADEYFYRIPVNSPSKPSVIHKHYEHDMVMLEDTVNPETYKVMYECTKCGYREERDYQGYIEPEPTKISLYTFWINSNGSMDDQAVKTGVDVNDKMKMRTQWSVADGVDPSTAAIVYDVYEWDKNSTEVKEVPTDNCVITTRNEVSSGKRYTYADISFKDSGVYVIYVRGNLNSPRDYKEVFEIFVTKPLEGVELTASPESPHVYGTDVTLHAKEDGGRGYEVYTFTVTDSYGNETVLEGEDNSNVRTWKADEPGTYRFKVSVYDTTEVERTGQDITVEDEIEYVVTKKASPDAVPSERYLLPTNVSTVSNDILGAEGWSFDPQDIGTELPLDEEQEFIVSYNGADRDYCELTEMTVTLKRTSCSHSNTVRRGAEVSTCCKEGWAGELYCEDCGEIIETNRKLPLDPNNHENIVTVPGKQADLFMNDGYTSSEVCEACGATVRAAEKISKITSMSFDPGSEYYTGSPITYGVVIKAGDYVLKEGKDYYVTYENNVNPGTATMIIHFIGNYNDTYTKKFQIKSYDPYYPYDPGYDPYNPGSWTPFAAYDEPDEIVDLPAVKISKPAAAKKAVTVKWKKVSKKNQKKIQGIEIQIATDPGFTNIVKYSTAGKKKTSKKIKGLTSKQTYYVRIRAYKDASDGYHVSGWKSKKVKVK